MWYVVHWLLSLLIDPELDIIVGLAGLMLYADKIADALQAISRFHSL